MASAPPTFTGDWIVPTDATYEVSISRWSANCERPAKVVAFVKSTADIALIIKYAREQNLTLVVRSGGHSVSAASSVDGGIVLDLSRYFTDVQVDPAAKVVRVAGGALWKSVDAEAIKHGLATVSGTTHFTGVGGVTLGGGYGYLAGEHGLIIDNLKQVTIVIANGQVLTVNDTENPDLFWAVRGGGGNFGVVTEFVLQLHPQRSTVFAGAAIFPPAKNEQIMTALQSWYAKGLNPKESIMHGIAKGPQGVEGREHFKAFFDIGPIVDKAAEIPFVELNDLIPQPNGLNYHMKAVFTSGPPDASLSKKLLKAFEAAPPGFFLMSSFDYLPCDKIMSVPVNCTAHIRGRRANNFVVASWAGPRTEAHRLAEIEPAFEDVFRTIVENETKLAAETNTGYASMSSVDPGQSDSGVRVGAKVLFGGNYPRLQQLKKIYDPEQVFSKWCAIVPA